MWHGNLTFGYVKAARMEAIFTSSVTTIAGGVVHLHHTSEKVAVMGVLPVWVAYEAKSMTCHHARKRSCALCARVAVYHSSLLVVHYVPHSGQHQFKEVFQEELEVLTRFLSIWIWKKIGRSSLSLPTCPFNLLLGMLSVLGVSRDPEEVGI